MPRLTDRASLLDPKFYQNEPMIVLISAFFKSRPGESIPLEEVFEKLCGGDVYGHLKVSSPGALDMYLIRSSKLFEAKDLHISRELSDTGVNWVSKEV